MGKPHGLRFLQRAGRLDNAVTLPRLPDAQNCFASRATTLQYAEAGKDRMAHVPHDHDDPHTAPLSETQLRVKALESLLTETGLVGVPKPPLATGS